MKTFQVIRDILNSLWFKINVNETRILHKFPTQ